MSCRHKRNHNSPSSILCSTYRSLKCARITLHMNLFTSFAANNFLWILWYRLIVGDPYVIQTYEVCIEWPAKCSWTDRIRNQESDRWLHFISLSLSQTPCIILHLVLHYFMLSNYAWMLCEGFYLHTVLVSAFISEQRLVRWLMAFGWIAPAIVLVLYGLFRGFHGQPYHREQ